MKKSLRLLALVMVLCMVLSFGTVVMASGEPASAEAGNALVLADPAWELSADGSYYSLKNVVYCTNVINASYQYMNIYVPAAYIDGGEVNGYTADTAPIIIENNCMGWNSSTPGNAGTAYIKEGFVHISVGARSRNAENGTGKMPAPVVDQKAAVRMLRLNADVIPGDEEKIVSLGSSGGGQMSSILGATGNMDEYYPYLYEIGAAGIELVNGEYISTIDDNIYASMCYCPIVDLNNADLAYAWMRYDAGETSAMTMFSGEIQFSDFQLELQNDLAAAFAEYINGLDIENAEGEILSFDTGASGEIDTRSGSYYDQILQNMSDALNAWIDGNTVNGQFSVAGGASSEPFDSWDAYYASLVNPESWLTQNADGTWSITDMAGFLNGTGLARNKDIPGFDTFFATEEGNGFGTADEAGMHFSANVAAVLAENYDEYAAMNGFADQDVDVYMEQAAREDIQEQAYLLNATQIMLGVANGTEESDIARHWRTRNGTADEHTSFTIAYNLAMSAQMAGAESVDYALVWNMGHGSDEGTTTGTFVDWVHKICSNADASEEAAPADVGAGSPANSGTYTYTETNVYGLEILWTLELSEDGTYALTEDNVVAGVVTYTGTYTANGDIITCGPMAEVGPPVYDWSNPAGFTVTVSGAGFVPGGAAPAAAAALSDGGWPLTGSGDTSMDAYKSYMKAYMDCVPEMDGHEEELYGLIDLETFDLPPVVMAFEDWFQENAMSYDEFVAAGGNYSLESFGITNPANGSPV